MFRKRFSVMPPPSPQPPSSPLPGPNAFLLCPVGWLPVPVLLPWQQELYQRALAEAQAVVRPSIVERDLLGTWN